MIKKVEQIIRFYKGKSRVVTFLTKNYYVDDLGRLYSGKKLMSNNVNKDGYICNALYDDNNKPIPVLRHNVVMQTFFPEKYMEGLSVDHIDRNRANNILTNLRWATPQQQAYNSKNNKNFYEKVFQNFLDVQDSKNKKEDDYSDLSIHELRQNLLNKGIIDPFLTNFIYFQENEDIHNVLIDEKGFVDYKTLGIFSMMCYLSKFNSGKISYIYAKDFPVKTLNISFPAFRTYMRIFENKNLIKRVGSGSDGYFLINPLYVPNLYMTQIIFDNYKDVIKEHVIPELYEFYSRTFK